MMKYIVLDSETTTSNGGNPFDQTNSLSVVGLKCSWLLNTLVFDICFSALPYGNKLAEIQSLLDQCDFIIGFNLKFDLHWLRRVGLKFSHLKIWDCQYVEYCITCQQEIMPSLENTCVRRGLGNKVVIDWTKQVSLAELLARVTQDCLLTEKLFLCQKDDLEKNPQLKKLCWYGSQDILVTEEMEWNGIAYDFTLSKSIGDSILQAIGLVDSSLHNYFSSNHIRFGNHWDVSAILYGGPVGHEEKESVTRILKSGKESTRLRNVIVDEIFPRIVEPLSGSKLKREGDWWATDEKTLRSLKPDAKAKEVIDFLLERAKLQKKVGTYFHGIPELHTKMQWAPGFLHGQLIHCRSATGRLSSKNPNQQNFDEEVRKCIVTRFQEISTNKNFFTQLKAQRMQ